MKNSNGDMQENTMAILPVSAARLTPLDEALAQLLASVSTVLGVERVGLSDSLNRVLAEDLRASIQVPPAATSAMDGFAIRANEQQLAAKGLPISQRVAAGRPGQALQVGTAARIFTGAVLPAGADAVVMQENCLFDDVRLIVKEAVAVGENVRHAGSDIAQDSLLLAAGQRLRAVNLGLLAAAGIDRLKVYRRLRVAVLTTGDELVSPGNELEPGQIYNSNFAMLAALLQELGCEVIDVGIVADTLEATRSAFEQAAAAADCVISSGGVSVGEEDHVKAVLASLGRLELWKLAVKPGKPFAFGHLGDTPFCGLPGNPVSAFINFVLLVRPLLLRLSGARPEQARRIPVPSGFNHPRTGVRQEFLRVNLVSDPATGAVKLIPYREQSSGAITSLSRADGLAVVPPFTSIVEGDNVNYISLLELTG